MDEWKTYKLGNLVEITSSKRIMRSEYLSKGVPFFRSKEIIELNNGSDISTELFISNNKYEEIKNKFGVPQKGDMLLTSVGTLGIPYLVQERDKFYFKDGNLTWFRNFKNELNSKFLFYWISSQIGEKKIAEITIGSTQKALTIIGLKSLDIDIPPIDLQLKIVSILDSLSQKIQLNTQTNQTLEAIAQAIFKSWFIDFDPVKAKAQAIIEGKTAREANFAAMAVISGKTIEELNETEFKQLWEIAEAFPSEMMVSEEFGEIPKGWEVSNIGDTYDVQMGQSPNGETYNEKGEGILFYQGRAEFNWRFPSPRLFTTDPKRIAQKNDILLSVRAPVGNLNIALEQCCIGRGLAALRHKSGFQSFALYQLQSLEKNFNVFNGEGTVFGSINQKDLKAIKVILPDIEVLKVFQNIIESIDKRIENNELNSLTLSEVRDVLLPKFLNREISL